MLPGVYFEKSSGWHYFMRRQSHHEMKLQFSLSTHIIILHAK